jgi:hypothetical protein
MAARTWLRLCAVAIIATGLAAYGPVYAQAQTVPAAKVLAPLPPDVAFGRFIALIRGHLLTGEELVVRRQWDAARPHFNFPTEEVYGVIRGELRSYKTPPFDGALKSLARTVKSHSARQYPGALRKVESALAAADTGLKARQPDWARFQVKVAVEVLKTAPDEFDDAVAGGRIVRPIGYQSARWRPCRRACRYPRRLCSAQSGLRQRQCAQAAGARRPDGIGHRDGNRIRCGKIRLNCDGTFRSLGNFIRLPLALWQSWLHFEGNRRLAIVRRRGCICNSA